MFKTSHTQKFRLVHEENVDRVSNSLDPDKRPIIGYALSRTQTQSELFAYKCMYGTTVTLRQIKGFSCMRKKSVLLGGVWVKKPARVSTLNPCTATLVI